MLALVIEDNPDDVILLRRSLLNAELTLDLLIARTADEAIDQIADISARSEAMPNLIICDLNLPGISGLDLIEMLRTSEYVAGIPIVGYTGSQDPELAERFFSAGGVRLLNKDEGHAPVIECIRAYMA